jgi:hypothetical protein
MSSHSEAWESTRLEGLNRMHPVQLFELVFIMLLAILVLHWIALRLKLPPAVALLVGGGALAFVPGLPVIELDPELVLVPCHHCYWMALISRHMPSSASTQALPRGRWLQFSTVHLQ